jgi:hypothetical protein
MSVIQPHLEVASTGKVGILQYNRYISVWLLKREAANSENIHNKLVNITM